MKKNFIDIKNFTKKQIDEIITIAKKLKKTQKIFQKFARTRLCV